MTKLIDILRDFQTDTLDLVTDATDDPDEFEELKEGLLNEYIEVIKARLIE